MENPNPRDQSLIIEKSRALSSYQNAHTKQSQKHKVLRKLFQEQACAHNIEQYSIAFLHLDLYM
jgi:hypothetical protein